jgi:uncharacterized membrane protein YdbT with pleckstrin-like domain
MREYDVKTMGYIDHNMISGEAVAYKARMSWIVFLKPLPITLVFAGLASLMFYLALNQAQNYAGALEWIGAGLVVAALIPLVMAAMVRANAEFAVTNKRVILKTGFIQKKTAEMFLNKIESVGVEQSIAGRVFGYGTIVLHGTGGTLEPFHQVSAPLEFRRQIQEQIGRTFEPKPHGELPTS